ncbi:hypothetical protein AVEN_270931-1 [Araneus ventricosus]|uniref:BED-type domain-containing protein n=1 Tax=Araneus ventricosus TaxID=182803 RepID=A0A4Y2R7T7_ARAVE|nr:hypothetical protein AVEN_270931-1 [Araneus ventricosus]
MHLTECIRKLNKCGTCYCVVCGKELMYGSKGYIALIRHVKSVKHGSFLQSRKENFALSGSGDSKTKRTDIPYGLHPMFAACRTAAEVNLPQTSTPLSDRIVNYEVILLRFLAEKSLPYSLAPDLFYLVKEMAKYEKALNQVMMHRTATS